MCAPLVSKRDFGFDFKRECDPLRGRPLQQWLRRHRDDKSRSSLRFQNLMQTSRGVGEKERRARGVSVRKDPIPPRTCVCHTAANTVRVRRSLPTWNNNNSHLVQQSVKVVLLYMPEIQAIFAGRLSPVSVSESRRQALRHGLSVCHTFSKHHSS